MRLASLALGEVSEVRDDSDQNQCKAEVDAGALKVANLVSREERQEGNLQSSAYITMAYKYAMGGVFLLLITIYLWHVNRGMSGSPPDAAKLLSKRWTPDKVREAYEKTKSSPTDVSKHIPPKQGRRYIVIGGSGLVGGWIVQHLLIRGMFHL